MITGSRTQGMGGFSLSQELDDIICIGVVKDIEVNVYANKGGKRPCVELRRHNGVQMHLSEVEDVIDLLSEAVAFWKEEGF
jgi:hypothetical protein